MQITALDGLAVEINRRFADFDRRSRTVRADFPDVMVGFPMEAVIEPIPIAPVIFIKSLLENFILFPDI